MSSTISFSGLSSGIDTSSWIDALVSVKQSTLTSLQSAQVTQQGLLSVVNDIKSFFSSFQGCLQKLTDSKLGVASMDLFLQNLATSSNNSIATATATTDASRQSYDVLVDQLASATKATSGTTTKVASNAALDTTLGTLGATAGTITVNNQSFSISANDTLSTLITKFSNVGITASYSNTKGTFTVDCSVSDIDDGTTGLKTALKLSDKTVAAASSGTLVYANANTQFSKLGLTAGAVTIEGNNYTISKVDDTNYKIAKDGDAATNISTIGDFLSYLTNTVGADSATIDDKGNVLIRGAVLASVNGGSNILNVLNLNEITDRTVMDSDPITVDVSHVADANTKLSDLGITDAQTLAIAGVSKPNISTDTTLGQIEQLLKNNGVDMTISNTGVISVDTNGNEVTGTLFDALGLKSSDQGTTIQSASHPITLKATSDTLLSDLGVTNAMSYVGYDSSGSAKTGTINNTSGLSVGNFITQLKGEGLDASFDSTTGKISINNGYISGTVADTLGMVQSKTTNTSTATGATTLAELGATGDQTLIVNGGTAITYDKSTTLNTIMQAIQSAGGTAALNNGAMTVTNANLGGTVSTLLGLDANTQGSTMKSGNLSVITNSTSTGTSGVNAGVETNITMASTLGDILGTTANQNLIIDGVTKTYASTATLGSINSDITAAGGQMTINSDNTLAIDGVTLSGGLVSAFGLTSDSKATNITSNTAIKVGGLDEYATLGTTLADLGATGNSTLSINGAAGLTFDTTKTIGDVFNAITAAGGTAAIKDGVVTVTGVTLTGTVPDLLKLAATNSGTSVTSGNLTYVTSSTSTSSGVLATSTSGNIDWNTTLGEMFGTTGVNYGLDYTAVSNGLNYSLSYNSSTTLSSIRDALAVNGVNMTINDDSSISFDGLSSATGTLATALGLDPDKYKTSSVSDGTVMVSAGIHNADANTTFDQLAVINNTLSSASSRYYAVYSTAGYRDGSNNNVPTLIQSTSNNGSSGTSTIGNWLTSVNSALNTANGTSGVNYATINNGVISITGGYVTGALADALGITSTTVNSGKVMTGSSVSYVESHMSDFIGTAVTMSGTTQGSLTVNSSGYITGTTIATGTTQGSVNVNSSGYITVTTNATGTTQGSVNVVASGYIGNVVGITGNATQYTYTGNNLSYSKTEGSSTNVATTNGFETGVTNITGPSRVYSYTTPEKVYNVRTTAPGYNNLNATVASVFGSAVIGTTIDTDVTINASKPVYIHGELQPSQMIDGDSGEFTDSLTITASTTISDILGIINNDGVYVQGDYDSSTGVLTTSSMRSTNGSGILSGTFFDTITSYKTGISTTGSATTVTGRRTTTTYQTPSILVMTNTPTDVNGSTTLSALATTMGHQAGTPYTFTINKADGSTVNLTFDSSGTSTINDVFASLASKGITGTISNGKLAFTSNFDWSASGDLGSYLAGTLTVNQNSFTNGYIGTVTQQTGATADTKYRYSGSTVTYSSTSTVPVGYPPETATLASIYGSGIIGKYLDWGGTVDWQSYDYGTLVRSGTNSASAGITVDSSTTIQDLIDAFSFTDGTDAISNLIYYNTGELDFNTGAGSSTSGGGSNDDFSYSGSYGGTLLSAIGATGSSSYTANVPELTSTLTLTSNMAGTTTMAQLFGDSNAHYLTITKADSSQINLAFNSSHTLNDVISSLGANGITATISDGKMSFVSGYQWTASGDLGTKLKGTSSWTPQAEGGTAYVINGSTVMTTGSATVYASLSTRLADANIGWTTSTSGTVTYTRVGHSTVTNTVTGSSTIQQLLNYLPTGSSYDSSTGVLTVSYDTDMYTSVGGSALMRMEMRPVEMPDDGSTTVSEAYGYFELTTGSSSTTANLSTTVGSLYGDTLTHSFTFYNNGSSRSVSLNSSMTMGDVVSALNNAGLTTSFSNGKFQLSSTSSDFSINSITADDAKILGTTPSSTSGIIPLGQATDSTQNVSAVSSFQSGYKYHISTVADLNKLASLVNSGVSTSGISFVLDNDINMSSVSNFAGIGNSTYSFSGSFYGNGHIVSNLTMNSSSDNVGFFGNASGGTIQDVGLSNVNITGGHYVGGLVGHIDGTTISNNYVAGGTVSGFERTGGLVGFGENGTVTDSYATANVISDRWAGGLIGYAGSSSGGGNLTVDKSYATGNASGRVAVGGFVGQIYSANVSNSYATGNAYNTEKESGGFTGSVTLGSITNCYAFGTATGASLNGGFAGTNANMGVTFTNAVYNSTNSSAVGTGSSTGIVGLSSSQMQTESTMEGYGFISANGWNYTPGSTPKLGSSGSIPQSNNNNTQKVSDVSTFLAGNTYHISTAADLTKLSSLVNSGVGTTNVNFVLDNDIDMSSVSNFTSIGNSSVSAFKGTFYGNGHSISNLTINSSSTYSGLFGMTDGGATIKDLAVKNISVSGGTDSGGIVGFANNTTINNVYSDGGSVSGISYAGGLVGYASNSNISNSFSTVSVASTCDSGGLVGYSYNNVMNRVYASGDVSSTSFYQQISGGLIGLSNGDTITNAYAMGSVITNSASYGNSGGLIGRIYQGSYTNVYASGTASGPSTTLGGGLVGEVYLSSGSPIGPVAFTNAVYNSANSKSFGGTYSDSGVTGLNSTQMATAATMQAKGFTAANGWSYASGLTPTLGNVSVAGQTVYVKDVSSFTSGSTYHISTVADLNQLASLVNSPKDTTGVTFVLDNNIDMSSVSNFAGIGSSHGFNGAFYGNGYSISNLKQTGASKGGLFGNINLAGSVQDLAVTNASISATTGGILASGSSGTINNCYTTGTISAEYDTGGLVGGIDSFSSITNSYSTATVTSTVGDADAVGGLVGFSYHGTITKSYATGTVTGSTDVGGLVGTNSGTINNSYATGTVTGSTDVGGLVGENVGTITNAYSVGKVTGSSSTGGFVGSITSGSISNGIYNSTSAASGIGSGSSGGVVSLTASQMETESTMEGYGFTAANGWSYVAGSTPGFGSITPQTISTLVTNTYNATSSTTLGDLFGTTNNIALSFNGYQTLNLSMSASNTIQDLVNQINSSNDGMTASFSGGKFSLTSFVQQSSTNSTIFGGTPTVTTSNTTQYVSGVNGFVSGDTYHISTIADLNRLASMVNSGVDTTGVKFVLDNNIDMSSAGNFAGIGTGISNSFRGQFYGNGHTISNLKMTAPGSNAGLFGALVNATVQDLALTGVNITATASNAGALAGYSTGSTINNVYSTGSVSSSDYYAGGLVGEYLNGTITNSYSSASVTGSNGVGGFVGYSNGTDISKSYATGNATGVNSVGGFIGVFAGSISNAYSTGTVTGTGNNVGGFVGVLNSATINTAYSIGTVVGSTSTVGGFIGTNSGGTVTNGVVEEATNIVASVGSGSSTGVTSLTIAQMKNSSTMQGYGFTAANGWNYNQGSIPQLGGESITNTAGGIQYVSGINNFVSGDTYHIKDYTDLTKLASLVNGGQDTTGVTFILDNNIDMASVANFAGIGNSTTAFKGTFDGNGHTISNLKMNSTSDGVGFFGTTSGGSVQDLALVGANVYGSQLHVGILAGNAYGTTINNVYTSGTAKGYDSYVGGLVGQLYYATGSITNSYSTATVSSTVGDAVGGLVGGSRLATISKSYATGNVTGASYVGGLVGYSRDGDTITNTYATGTVTGSSLVGGLVGYNVSGSKISNSYSIGAVTGFSATGGFVGQNDGTITNGVYEESTGIAVGAGSGSSTGVTSLTIAQMKNSSTMQGYGFTAANGWNYNSGSLPQLGSESITNTAGSTQYVSAVNNFVSGDTYHISTVADMNKLASLVNGGQDTTGVTFILDNNIDMSSVANFAGIASSNIFSGTFDGNGHIISNLKESGTSKGGLFGMIDSSGSIKDLAITNANISGSSSAGILASYSSGIISNVYTTGKVSAGDSTGGLIGYLDSAGSVTNSYSTATVSGAAYTGGLVGLANANISKSFATGTVTGTINVGGLVGFNPGIINNSYSTGTVSGSTNVGGFIGQNLGSVTNVYSLGAVSGSSIVGGLIGQNSGTITGSVYNAAAYTTAVGSGSTSGITRLSITQMSNSSTMQGIGFSTANGWKYSTGKLPTLGNETVTQNAGSTVYVKNVTNLVNGDTYHITDYNDLTQLASLVNSGQDTTGIKFVVDNDIDMSSVANFAGIGNATYAFKGSFYGNGHTISNLKESSTTANTGFFGMTNGATIQDLQLSNANVSSSADSAGILVGSATNTTITNVNTSGTVHNNNSYVGGLAGIASGGSITNSYSTASVSGSTIVGGLVGTSSATISKSFASGTVTGSNGSASRLGGFVGQINGGSITDSYASGNVTGYSQVGGFIGWSNDGAVTRSYASGKATGSIQVGGFTGNDQSRVTYTNVIYNTDLNPTSVGTGARPGITGLTLGNMEVQSTMESYGFTTANGWKYATNMTPQLQSVVSTSTINADTNSNLGELGANTNSELTMTIGSSTKTFTAENTVNDVLAWAKTQSDVTDATFNSSKLVVTSKTNPNLSVTGGLADILFNTGSPATTILTTTTNNASSQEKYIPPDVKLTTDTTIARLLHQDLTPSDAQLIIGGDVQAVLTFKATDTVQNVIDTLAGYGITASVDSNGKFTATGNVNFSLAGAIGNTLMEATGTSNTSITGYKSDIEQGTKSSNATAATLLSDLGITSGNIYIKNAQDQNVGTIAIDNTLSINQLSDLLSNYGFTASITNGKYTVTSDNGTYLADSSSNAISKLGLSTWTDSSSSLKSTTTLSEMGFTNGTTLGIIKDGSTIGPISFSGTDTLQSIIDTLKVYGIDASVDSNGAFKATSSGAFVFTGDLGNYLTSKGSTGTGYITTVNGYTSSQPLKDKTDVSNLNDDTTVGELLKTGQGGLLRIIKNNSDVIEVQYGADEKVSNIISDLASVGIKASVDSNGVFTASSSDEFSLGGDVGKSLLGSSATVTDKDDGYTSNDLSYTKTSTATGSSVLSDIGVNSGKIYVLDSNGKIVTSVGIDNSTTLDQTIGLLKPYGLDMSIDSSGKVTVSSEDGYTLSDGTSNLVSKLKLSTWNKTSEKLSTSTTISEMGFKDGADMNLILDGGSTQVLSFSAEDTLQDVINGLSAYGITGSVDSNGAFTATSKSHTFVMSSDLGSYLSKGTTGYVTQDTGYKTASTLNASDPYVAETSKTLTYNTNMSLNSTMADLGFAGGAGLKVTLDGNTPYTLSFLATDKVSDVVYALSAYGINATVDGTGKFTAESTDHTFTLSGSLGSYLTSGTAGYDNEDTGYTSAAKTYTTEEQITSSTKLSDLGVATGSLNIVQNGVVSKNTIKVTDSTTVGQLFSAISAYGLTGSIKTDGSGDNYLEISANSNTKLVDGTSDLINKLDLKDVEQGDYSGNVEYWDNTATSGGLITNDMLLSSFDKDGKKAAGSFIFTTGSGDDSTQHIVNITSSDTVGSLLTKLQNEGVSASLSDGIIHVSNGVDGIAFNGGTSGLTDTVGLVLDDTETYATSTSALTYQGSETASIANYADASTTLNTMNITDGNLSVYVNGVKCTVAVNSSDTFGGLFSKIKSSVLTKTGQTIEVGFLDKDGNIVSNPTESNNTGVVSFKVADGTKLVVGATNDTTNFATIANFEQESTNQVSGQRSLFKVNTNSVLTQAGLFRDGNVTAGTFKVGDADFTIDSNTTISSLINQINSSDKSYATAYWDTLSGTMVLQSTLTGASLMNIEAGTSNFTDIIGLTKEVNGESSLVTDNQALGKNAVVRINGTTVSATSNTITSDVSKIKGLTINLKGLSSGESTTITVAEDDDGIYQAVSDTVDSYNSLMKELDKQLSSSTDVANDSIIKLMRNNLKYLMTSSITGSHTYKNLASVGITTGSSTTSATDTSSAISALSINKDAFMAALSGDSDSVKNLLVGTISTPGILLQVSNIVDNALNSTGYFSTYTQSINSNINKLSTKISGANTELSDYRAKLEKQFKNMESTVTGLQNAYSNFLNNISSTSSTSSFGIDMSSSSPSVGISTAPKPSVGINTSSTPSIGL